MAVSLFTSRATLILASGSPRRQQMLQELGIPIEVVISKIDETPIEGESPELLVRRLALSKAKAVACQYPSRWVLGADTDVSIDGEILGKPLDAQDAVRLLSKLQGRTHQVWGAFALVNIAQQIEHCESHRTLVDIATMEPSQIESYVRTGDPLDKAGAYGAQGIGAQFVNSIQGSYTNVVGLPLGATINVLRKFGVISDAV